MVMAVDIQGGQHPDHIHPGGGQPGGGGLHPGGSHSGGGGTHPGGAGCIQVEVLAYILAEVGIVSRVKYKKTPHCAEFFYGVYEKLFG